MDPTVLVHELAERTLSVSHVAFEGEDRSKFWQELYCTRPDETALFERIFLLPEHAPLLLLSGPVGSGKSTFLLHKLEHAATKSGEKLCYGIRLDMKGIDITRLAESHSSAKNVADAQVLAVRSIVQTATVDAIRRTILASFYRLGDADFDFNHPHIGIDPVDAEAEPSEVSPLDANEAILKMVAVLACTQGTPANQSLRLLACAASTPSGTAEVYHAIKQVARKNPSYVTAVLGQGNGRQPEASLVYWAKFLLYVVPHNRALIAIDNADVVPFGFQKYVMQAVDDMARSLASKRVKVRFVLAVRDENIPTAAYRERMGKHKHLVLSDASLGYIDASLNNASGMPLLPQTMSEILRRRLKLFVREARRESIAVRQLAAAFARIFREVWINQFRHSEDKGGSRQSTDLVGLTNESVRLAIELATEATFSRLRKHSLIGPVGSERIPAFVFRHEAIEWLFESDPVGRSIIERCRIEHERVVRGDSPCETCRLVLTVLSQLITNFSNTKRPSPRIMFKDLKALMHQWFDIDESELREVLWFLFHPDDYEREFVSLYSDTYLNVSSDITNRTEVCATRRGLLFVGRIVQTPEYWCRLRPGGRTLAPLSDGKHDENLHTMYTVATELVDGVVHRHLDAWRKLVHRDVLGVTSVSRPFSAFSDRCALRGHFYLERTAASHGRYVLELLTSLCTSAFGDDRKPDAQVIQLLKEVELSLTDRTGPFSPRRCEIVRGRIAALSEAAQILIGEQALSHASECMCFYTNIASVFASVRLATVADIKEKWQEVTRMPIRMSPGWTSGRSE